MITFTDYHAQTKAGRLARAARRAALACVLVLGAGGALAQQNGDRRDYQGMPPQQGMQDGPRPKTFYLPPPDRDGRPSDPRGMDNGRGMDAARGIPQDPPEQGSGRGGRMTPDERRDLRRQINEVGRDLYHPRRR